MGAWHGDHVFRVRFERVLQKAKIGVTSRTTLGPYHGGGTSPSPGLTHLVWMPHKLVIQLRREVAHERYRDADDG